MKLVDAALKLDEVCDDWSAQFLPLGALEFVRRAGSYNRCFSENLTALVQECIKLTPKGSRVTMPLLFRIGNEGSRVIYLRRA